MKSLRYFSTISLLALATVLATAQDGGLGRGRGGGGGNGGGQSSPPPTRPSSPPPSNPPASSPPPSRSTPPPQSAPPTRGGDNSDRGRPNQDSGLGRGGSSGGGSQSGGPSRDRGGSGSGTGSGSQSGGPTRDRGGSTGSGGSSQSGGPTRDRGGSGTGNSNGGSQSGGPTRDRGGSTSGGPTRGGSDSGLGRPNQDSGLGRSRGTGGASQGLPDRGRTNYNTNSNVRVDRAPTIGPVSAPPGIVRTDQLALKARRQDGTFRANDNFFNNGWRTGYCHYNTGWNDNFFFYNNYCFNPWQTGVSINVVVSPWYLYPFLPGYLNCNTVVVTSYRSPWIWNTGTVYVYDDRGFDNRWDWNSNNRRNVDLDNSLEDLRDGFERYDRRALSSLVPRNGQVAIMRDGRYDYSMNSDDFYDLINDLASNAQTNSYRVDQIRTYRDSARVVMVHDYNDPWGRRQRVYHSMLLQREGRGMVIREFETNDRRAW